MKPEQPVSEQLADIKEPSQQEPGLEIANTPELKGVVDIANNLAEKIQRDEDVTAGEVFDLEEKLSKIKINFFGKEMTVQELRNTPNVKENKKVWEQINAGNLSALSFDDMTDKLTYANAGMVRRIIKICQTPELWNENGATVVTRALKENQGMGLCLNGVRKMSIEALQEAVKCKGGLDLGLESLSPEEAKLLAEYSGGRIRFCRVAKLDKQIAEWLGQSKAESIEFFSLQKIDAETATELVNFQGKYLGLRNFTELDLDVAQELAKIRGGLGFDITSISPEVAQAFSIHEGKIYMQEIKHIDFETIKNLANHKGSVSLIGVEELDKESIKYLASHKNKLSFNNEIKDQIDEEMKAQGRKRSLE